uniref:O-methyltransferase dimerisation domain-containing protein n=1 Tax=Triticum urartu TaxID=4572 RepID=A0A8R7TTY1_TRIUA
MATFSYEELLQAHTELWDLTFGYLKSMALECAIKLGLPNAIHRRGGAATLPDLLDAVSVPGSKKAHLPRLMRVSRRVRHLHCRRTRCRGAREWGGGGRRLRPHAGVPPAGGRRRRQRVVREPLAVRALPDDQVPREGGHAPAGVVRERRRRGRGGDAVPDGARHRPVGRHGPRPQDEPGLQRRHGVRHPARDGLRHRQLRRRVRRGDLAGRRRRRDRLRGEGHRQGLPARQVLRARPPQRGRFHPARRRGRVHLRRHDELHSGDRCGVPQVHHA